VHPEWGHYPDTVLAFPEAGIEVDLRRTLSPYTRSSLIAARLAGPFAVVTACNPFGRPLGSMPNQRLTALLEAVVMWQHPGAQPADGRSADGSHVEPGWALCIPLEVARGLAARFFQNALFWFDGDRFHLVPVLASGPPLPLPVEPVS
jgi:hypothetical protein